MVKNENPLSDYVNLHKFDERRGDRNFAESVLSRINLNEYVSGKNREQAYWMINGINAFITMATRGEFLFQQDIDPYAIVETKHHLDVLDKTRHYWNLRTGNQLPIAGIFAALYHDCDRYVKKGETFDPTLLTKRRTIDTRELAAKGYADNKIKKVLHPENCAKIALDYMPFLPQTLARDVSFLINQHELGNLSFDSGEEIIRNDEFTGNCEMGLIAKDLALADALSYLTVIHPAYMQVNANDLDKVGAKATLCGKKILKHDLGMRIFTEMKTARQIPTDEVSLDGEKMSFLSILEKTILNN